MRSLVAAARWGLLALLWITTLRKVQGGLCWKYRYSNRTCRGLVSSTFTEKECCSSGMGVAYTSKYVDENIFRYIFVTVPSCVPCKAPCDIIKCDKDKSCELTASGTATCRCNPDCGGTHKGKVCGSDGRTYSSECELLRKKCISGKNLNLEYFGTCKAMCKGVQCLDGKVCLTDRFGQSYCVKQVCPKKCNSIKGRHVCGTDKITYSSVCHLLYSGCKLGRKISVAYMGTCRDAKCDNVACPPGKGCVMDSSGQPRCIPCECNIGNYSLPVCGSDGKRYPSWCHMRRESCLQKRLFTVDLSGKC